MSRNERGAVTVELAIGIPVAMSIVALALGAIRWGMDAVTATTVAAESALALGRGEQPEALIERAHRAIPDAQLAFTIGASENCTTVSLPSPLPLTPPQEIRRCVKL